MTAYDQEKLDALHIQETAQDWHKNGLISDAEWEKAKSTYPTNLYIPNWIVRIGLAIFTSILLQTTFGLIWLVFNPSGFDDMPGYFLLMGILAFFILEKVIIAHMRHYGSGVDDLTLYFGFSLLIIALFQILPSGIDDVAYPGFAFPLLLAATIRYIDRLLGAMAYCAGLLFILMLEQKAPQLAVILMPLSGILYSAGAYFFARMLQKKHCARHWHKVLVVIELLATITFYLSGNYWVIQQAGYELFQLETVPMAAFFWFFTFAVPVVYIWQGLRSKDRLLLDIGLGCTAVAIFTFRYYFHVLPLAWAAVFGGALLFGIAYFSIRHLRKKTGDYTYEPDAKTFWLQEVEEQLIEQTIANQPSSTPDKSGSFGGGQMGGGGAGSDF